MSPSPEVFEFSNDPKDESANVSRNENEFYCKICHRNLLSILTN